MSKSESTKNSLSQPDAIANQYRHNIVTDLLHVCRGALMGAADIIPGVSGGTVALIVGIYSRLVGAISRFDLQAIKFVRQSEWRNALEYTDFRFLIALATGIGLGAIALGSFIEQLLVHQTSRAITLSVFLGMILASTFIVLGLVNTADDRKKVISFILAAAGFGFAFWVTGLEAIGTAESLPYVFCCGLIGICAMILPGISGAYLLIILGFYPQLTDILHRVKDGDLAISDFVTVGVFAAGCLVGLIAFSKLLRRLLEDHLGYTMAVLAGFMLGAIRKVWPFQIDLAPDELKLKHKLFQPFMPEQWDGTVTLCVLAALGAFVLVWVVDRLSRTDRQAI